MSNENHPGTCVPKSYITISEHSVLLIKFYQWEVTITKCCFIPRSVYLPCLKNTKNYQHNKVQRNKNTNKINFDAKHFS